MNRTPFRHRPWRPVLFGAMTVCLTAGVALANGNLAQEYLVEATFGVNDTHHNLKSAFVIAERHPVYKLDYTWLTFRFYAFEFTSEDATHAARGHLSPIEKKWYAGDYNAQASVYLMINRENDVTQVDMVMPGYSCTVASTQSEIDNFLQEFDLRENSVTLRSVGEHTCTSSSDPAKSWTHVWDFAVDQPFFFKSADLL